MSVTSIKRQAQAIDKQLDPTRRELAQAIEAEQKAIGAAAAQVAAIERATAHVAACEAKLEAARAAVIAAREARARSVADAVSSGAAVSASGLTRLARAAERDAEDELDAARDALCAKLESGLAGLEDAVRQRRNDKIVARAAVMRACLRNVLERARNHRRQLRVAENLLAEFLNRDDPDAPGFSPDETVAHIKAFEARRAPLADLRAEAERFILGSDTGEESAASAAAVAAMRAAVTRLATDAGAELPSVLP